MNSDFNNSFCASPDMLDSYLKSFHLGDSKRVTKVVVTDVCGVFVRKYINEFWTAKQRKASSLHEISYRACFKPQLPHFFISLLTKKGDVVYDPFGGRGTVIVEAALCERYGISNDVNPLSEIFARPRLSPPSMTDIEKRLDEIEFDKAKKSDIDLSMFYQEVTLSEILSLREYLDMKRLM
ncbi:MAG TPA: DNA methyltransferase, partial [Methanocorpusculum sp.]|nr:DNA methyltransferase [Methanocorpusculum sp.]